MTNKVACIIPARMASTRFPGKPLARILGHSMIEHVYRRVKLAKEIDEIFIATCDHEIAAEAQKFGAEAIMTSYKHTRGTDRVAEAAQSVQADIVINVQGDEPLVDPFSLDKAVLAMKQDPKIPCINLIAPIVDWEVFVDRNVVKTTITPQNNVLYFSRQAVPTSTKENFKQAWKQIGIYFFRREFLLQFYGWPQTPLEQAEAVDMMRILEHGFPIKALAVQDMISVDTPAELLAMEKILREDPLYNQIFVPAFSQPK